MKQTGSKSEIWRKQKLLTRSLLRMDNKSTFLQSNFQGWFATTENDEWKECQLPCHWCGTVVDSLLYENALEPSPQCYGFEPEPLHSCQSTISLRPHCGYIMLLGSMWCDPQIWVSSNGPLHYIAPADSMENCCLNKKHQVDNLKV